MTQPTSSTQTREVKKRVVTDSSGHSYELTGKIGQGGQGIVCTTAYPNILVKINTHDSEEQRAEWLRHMRWIMQRPLDGIAISRPVAIIESPRPGYVMELMDGLVPLTSLLDETENSMLCGQTPQEKFSGFLNTGGVRRRVNLMARLARLLADLHGRGLAFGDLAPSNIFVSRSTEHSEVWLIDCDNLCASGRTGSQAIYTPDYGAPELLRGESVVSTVTDSWSFAVIAFRLMSLAHPLKGDVVNNGTQELEEVALRGGLPWVDDETNRDNALNTGLPRETVLSARLRELFRRCFGSGLHDPGARPSLSTWAEAFEVAAHQMVLCEGEGCGNTFIAETSLCCPFCGETRPSEKHLRLVHLMFAPELRDLEEAKDTDVWIQTGEHIVLSASVPHELRKSPIGSSLYPGSERVCGVELTSEGVKFSPCSGFSELYLQNTEGKVLPITVPRRLPTTARNGQRFVLHLGPVESGHTAWSFKW